MQRRVIYYKNSTGTAIPAGAAIEPYGGYDTDGYMKVRQPTRDNAVDVLFNGPGQVPVDGIGEAYPCFPMAAASLATEPRFFREHYGTKAGHWELHTDRRGFVVVGTEYNRLTDVMPSPMVESVAFDVESGASSGSGSSDAAGPTVIVGQIVSDKSCVGGVEYITTYDMVIYADGSTGLENEQTRGVGCCGCGCACEPVFYRYARFTFANRTGDMVAALPDVLDVTLDTWFATPACYWTTVTNPAFGNGAWAGQFQINPAPILYSSAVGQWIQFGLSAPNVGSTNTGVQTPATGWLATPSITNVVIARDGACGSGYSRHVGRYSFTAGGGESHPGTGEFDLYLDLIE